MKRLNERNIFDFNIKKSKNAEHVGPIQIALQGTDPKKYRFTMNVIADDKAIQKKDRNVNEPMQFYVRGVRAPYEIVVFEVAKDHITGYLSTPKDTGGSAAAEHSRTDGAAPISQRGGHYLDVRAYLRPDQLIGEGRPDRREQRISC